MICPNCKSNLEKEHNFCPSCGFDLRGLKNIGDENAGNATVENAESASQGVVICDTCGEETPDYTGYCESCGAKLTGKEKKVDKTVSGLAEKKVDNNEKSVKLNNAKIQKEEPVRKAPDKKQAKPQASRNESYSGSKGGAKIPPVQGRNQKSVNPLYIGIFVFALIAVGFVILYFSGVFGSHSQESLQSNAPQQQQQQTGSGVNLENIQRINELEGAVKADSTNLGNVLELAHLLNDSGFYERAIPYYRMYLRGNPRNVDVLVDMGVCYYNIRQYAVAIAEMKKGWSINPRHQTANFNLGIVNFTAGNADSAKIWWRRAIEIDPNSEIGKKAKELLDSH